jgi:hypothetical protein
MHSDPGNVLNGQAVDYTCRQRRRSMGIAGQGDVDARRTELRHTVVYE